LLPYSTISPGRDRLLPLGGAAVHLADQVDRLAELNIFLVWGLPGAGVCRAGRAGRITWQNNWRICNSAWCSQHQLGSPSIRPQDKRGVATLPVVIGESAAT
jgi:hypothetical protein